MTSTGLASFRRKSDLLMHYYSRDSPQFLWLAAQEESLGQVLIQPIPERGVTLP